MKNVIFDIDGVLIDVRRSFHETIKNTVSYYLKECFNLPVKRQAVSEEDINLIKSLGGFNDDWDVTAGFLYYFASLLPKIKVEELELDKIKDIFSLKQKLKNKIDIREKILEKSDIRNFVSKVKKRGLEGILKATRGKNQELVCFSGDVLKDNLVKRIFQEIYWGVDMFPKIYETKNLFYFNPGKIHKEILIADRLVLKNLFQREDLILSIITGREKRDAEHSLEKYDIKKYFKEIITLDNLSEEKDKKPSIYSVNCLNEKMKENNIEIEKSYYIGDQIDDILMANAAKKTCEMKSVGYIYGRDLKKKELMQTNKTDYIISSLRELLNLIETPKEEVFS
jgi:phosphoglycolate phosphatase-like HAD superfamily hydrolase